MRRNKNITGKEDTMKKKICSLLLALLMVVTMLPVTAMATDRLTTAPYAGVEYGYSASVTVGTVRYMSQNRSSGYFNTNYWGSWASQADSECGTCSISMALSYVGINKTPKDILDAHGGITHFDGWGVSMSSPSVVQGMNNFINGNGKYSPLVIHLPKYSSRGHYVILAGKKSDNVYQVVDPANNYVWDITINGTTATYSGKTDYIDRIYQYYNSNATIAPHTCDKGSYVYYWDAHPHYKCYQCSICGKIWADKTETTLLSSCDECRPGKPTLLNMQSTYEAGTPVTFAWNSTSNTSHYNLWLYRQDDFGEWQIVERIFYAESGISRTLSEGKYRVQLLSYNSEMWEADGSDWVHTYGDDCFFTVAKPELASGTCGENLTWVLEENGTLTVSGAGEMYNYARDSEPWKDYQSSITTVYIENGVSSIGDCAFESCEALTDVTIADSVTSIGKNAFACCSGLTSVTIPSSVTSIGEYAFQYCSSLKTVAIPDGITSIKKGTFYNCTGLTDVTIGKNVENIESGAFEYCKGLTSVTIPSSVSSITGNPFSECKKLTSITVADDNPSYMSKDGVLFEKNGETLLFCLQGKEGDYQIPDSVKSINSGAFFNCDKLTGITVPNSVTNIQEGTFFGCSNLTSIVIPNSVTSIGEAAFSRCRNLTQMIIPDSVVSMGTQVFSECTELKSVTLSKNMTAIPFNTFLSCKSLTSVTIPDGVTSISASAFNYCAALSSVTIPDSVAAIGWAAFSNCSALTDVYYDGTEEQWKQVKIDNSNDENKCLNNATIHFVQPEPQPQPPVESSGTIAIQSVRVQPGKAVTVRLDLSANKGISNMRLQLSYPDGFTLENIQKGDALSTLFFTPPGKLTANPVNFVWDGTDADTSEGCILELTFRVADTVSPGDYKIHMSYQKGDVLDNDLEDIDLTLQDGAVTVAQFTYGDVNDDGVINMKDLGALRKYFAGGYDADKFVMEAADVNGDGVVNMKDLGILRRYLAGGYDINLGK